MASATSKPAKVTVSEKQGRASSKGVDNYYKTEVTTLGDGSIKRETFRTDAQGNNSVKVQEVSVDKNGKQTSNTVSSNATAGERKALNNPDSQLRGSIKQQTKNAGDVVQKNEADAAGGGLTDAGRKNQEVLGGGSGNNANDEGETGDTSRPSAEPPKNKAGTREDFGEALHYPLTRDENQHVIKFDMLKYEPKKVQGFGFGDRSGSSERTIGTVTLPIPGGISDANACNWGDDSMGPLQLAAAGLALGALDASATSGGGIGGQLGDLKNQLVSNNEEMKQLIGQKAASAAVGSNENALFSRTQGTILNPNLELIFNGPSLRPFTFNFKMSPRSDAEAKLIAKIIRFFKQGMAPIREDSRLFLKTPHTFKIKYVLVGKGDEENPYLNKFKECALLSCSVQYTPEGNYAPYEDGAMSSYQMALQFKELEPVFNDDYGSDGDLPAEIGF
jgi:hypothetical protein